jgi:hypothetical protein
LNHSRHPSASLRAGRGTQRRCHSVSSVCLCVLCGQGSLVRSPFRRSAS